MNNFLVDLRFAIRMLFKSYRLSAIIIFTLAVGIGANTAIFSFTNGILLRPLPYDKPEQIVHIFGSYSKLGQYSTVSLPDYRDWQAESRSFSQMALCGLRTDFSLTGAGEAQQISGVKVAPQFFPIFGVRPVLGRWFASEEGESGQEGVIMLSYGIWKRCFGGDPEVVGKSVRLDGNTYNVVGVMPASFEFPEAAEVWMPLAISAKQKADPNRLRRTFDLYARLAPGVTAHRAQEEMDRINSELQTRYPTTNANTNGRVIPLQDFMVRNLRPALVILSIAVGAVLLIACANVANLLLARALVRQKEIGIRSAVGAHRLMIIRQLLTESVVLSVVGGAAGLLFAFWCGKLLIMMAPANLPRIQEVRLDSRVLLFTFAVSVLTGILFGLVPALQLSKQKLTDVLRGEKGSSAGRQHGTARNALVVCELGLSLALLVSAGLLMRSFFRLESVSLGFDPQRVVTTPVNLPSSRYNNQAKRSAFFERILEAVNGMPGDHSLGLATTTPFADSYWNSSITIEGQELPAGGELRARANSVSGGYFRALGIPLLRGRTFLEEDAATNANVVIINQALAKRYFPDADPLQKRITLEGHKQPSAIIGIVADFQQSSLSSPTEPEFYVCFFRETPSAASLVVRTGADPKAIAQSLRSIIQTLDPNLAIGDVRSLEDRIQGSAALPRFRMLVLALLAAAALCLAAVGIYGVISYSVSQRVHEIGIRIALGASRSDVMKLILKQGMTLTGYGLVIGIGLSLATSSLIKNQLFGVSSFDPVTLASVSLALGLLALLASYIPAARASRIPPLVALRSE